MRVLFIGNAEQLAFELSGLMPDIEPFTTTKELIPEEKYDAIIIQDQEVPIYELKHITERFNGIDTFYLVSYDIKQAVISNKISICSELNVTAISPKLSFVQKAEMIINSLNGEYLSKQEKKVVTFLGTHGQNGTSQTVLGVAAKLKELSKYSVVVLSLTSSNPPSIFFSKTGGVTLNELYTQISNNRSVIKAQDLKNLLYEDSEKGFYFLAGNQDYTKRNHYHIDDIEYLIDMLCSEFDIVLIDAGHDPDTNLTIQALQKADMKLINTTQQPIGSVLWKKMMDDILGPYLNITPDEFVMIVNFYSPDIPRRDVKTLENEMGVPEIVRIPDCGIEGILCEINRTLIYDTKNSGLKKQIQSAYHKIAMTILQRFDLVGATKEQESPKWFWQRK